MRGDLSRVGFAALGLAVVVFACGLAFVLRTQPEGGVDDVGAWMLCAAGLGLVALGVWWPKPTASAVRQSGESASGSGASMPSTIVPDGTAGEVTPWRN